MMSFWILHSQLAPGGLNLLVHRDQLAQRGTRQIFHQTEVQNNLLATILVDQREQFLTESFNVGFVENFFSSNSATVIPSWSSISIRRSDFAAIFSL